MKFQIEANYTTGDSFGYEDVTTVLEYEWKDEEIAKENLQAIADHYRAYQYQENRSYAFQEDPKIDFKNEWWYRELPCFKDEVSSAMWLLMDDKTKVTFTCPWIGYFESLNSLELKIKNEKVVFN